jgi:AcrR family transcriptional regulator
LAERPATGLRERNRLQNRERIYRAAVSLIVERGFEATTMDDIAARAEAARRTVFNHFPTKGEITHEWADRRRLRATEAAQRSIGDSGTVIDRLRAYFHELVGITEESPDETRQMLAGWLTTQGPIYDRARMPANLSSWIAAGRDDGTVNRKVDPRLAAEVLYDVYMGVLFRWLREDAHEPGWLEANLVEAIDLVLAGLQPSAPA